jgi:hypothetical protein
MVIPETVALRSKFYLGTIISIVYLFSGNYAVNRKIDD